MSRKSIAGALAVVLAVSCASIASAGGGGDKRQVIRLTAKSVGTAFVDNGQAGINRGDRLVVDGDLFRGAKKVGQADEDCVFVRVEGSVPTIDCVASVTLPGGQITFHGRAKVAPGTQTANAAVTGGTGSYRTARGEATLTVSGTGTLGGDVTIRLR